MKTYNLTVYSKRCGQIAFENRLSKKDMIETMRNCITKYAPDAVDAFDCILKNTTQNVKSNIKLVHDSSSSSVNDCVIEANGDVLTINFSEN